MNYILMADIIDSTAYHSETLMIAFQEIVGNVNNKYKKQLLSPLTITLGDEFQGIPKNLGAAIEMIIALEEQILSSQLEYKLRYVLHYGAIDTPINPEIAYGMMGEGLSFTRKRLNEIKESEARFDCSIKNKTKSEALSNAFVIYQNVIDSWSNEDSKAMALNFIKWKDYKLIAEKTGKNRSQIWKKEKSLDISSYFAIKNILKYLS